MRARLRSSSSSRSSIGNTTPVSRRSITARNTSHSRSAPSRITSASNVPRPSRVIAVSLLATEAISICQISISAKAAATTTSASMQRSAMALTAETSSPCSSHWPRVTRAAALRNTYRPTGTAPITSSDHAAWVAWVRNSSQTSSRANDTSTWKAARRGLCRFGVLLSPSVLPSGGVQTIAMPQNTSASSRICRSSSRLSGGRPSPRKTTIVCQPNAPIAVSTPIQRCQNQARRVVSGTRRSRSAPGARKKRDTVWLSRTTSVAQR